jgi:hypothetical protein
MFDRRGNVAMRARCECAHLSVRLEEGQELWTAFQAWHATYWRPIEVNREFAAHFRRPNVLQRALRWLLARMRRVVLDPNLDQEPASAVADRQETASG